MIDTHIFPLLPKESAKRVSQGERGLGKIKDKKQT